MATNWNATQLTGSLKRLGNDFNAAFPQRDTATDGAYGDRDHQASPSGHNLDDTPGSRPESEDSDSKPELRALDIDADHRRPGVTMQQVADRIIDTAADRVRLSYLIYNGRIAGRHTGWKWVAYNGSNPHTSHLHASGHPDHDENTAPWESVRSFGEDNDDMANADDVLKAVQQLSKRLDVIEGMILDANPGPGKSATVDKGLSRVRVAGAVQEEVRKVGDEIKAAISRIGTGTPGGGTGTTNTAATFGNISTPALLAEVQKRMKP